MILVTNPQPVPCEMEIINALFEKGLETLHIRKPDFDEGMVVDYISKIDNRFHRQVMIHSHYGLLDSFGLKGIHFTEKTKPLLPDFADKNCVKSMAVHELAGLEGVRAVDYILFSPVFPSVSKEGYSKEWDFDELKTKLSAKRNYNIVALGGITPDKLKSVWEMGFDDFAVLGSVWEPLKAGCTESEIINILQDFRNGW
ncbi:MAG TPA: thiamine phosphate synthase [Paludibacter sp.]|nr:thiamine phosphate synthase [Paludibacter sp.]